MSNARRIPIAYPVAGVIGLLAVTLVVLLLLPNSFSPSPKIIAISRGESFVHVVDTLAESDVIHDPKLFHILGRALGFSGRLKVGKYSFESGVSNLRILLDITEGKSTANPEVTIYEGLRASAVAHILKREIGIDSSRFMALMPDTALIGLRNTGASSLEGFLLPETYIFYWQTDEREIVDEMLASFRHFFVDSLQQRAKEMHFTISQVLTMASIVEGETHRDDERPIIAGLYYNRLKRGMRLEADPTVQYLIENGPRRLRLEDLRTRSPYNTYLRSGLPPGPISNPGRKSILAALYPAHTSYLYFVADGTGGHRFATTYAEHLRNVRKYRHAHAMALRKRPA